MAVWRHDCIRWSKQGQRLVQYGTSSLAWCSDVESEDSCSLNESQLHSQESACGLILIKTLISGCNLFKRTCLCLADCKCDLRTSMVQFVLILHFLHQNISFCELGAKMVRVGFRWWKIHPVFAQGKTLQKQAFNKFIVCLFIIWMVAWFLLSSFTEFSRQLFCCE